MKIAFVFPIGMVEKSFINFPLCFGYLQASVRDLAETYLIDCVVDKLDWQGYRQKLTELQPDIVGITYWSFNKKNVIKSAQIVRELLPETKIIIGGPHPSALPEETLEETSADYVFVGEAEAGLKMLVRRLNEGGTGLAEIPGLAYKDNGIKINAPLFEENLDTLGPIDWDFLKLSDYNKKGLHWAMTKNNPIAPIITTRGCPYPCVFCGARKISGYKIRRRSIENIFEEIDVLYKRHGIREIKIADDNFTFDYDFVGKFCREAIRRNYKGLAFATPNGVRVDRLTEEIILLMKTAGWHNLLIAVESGSKRTLERMRKNLDLDICYEKISLIKKCGLSVGSFFIIGFPEETKEDIYQTFRFAWDSQLDFAFFHLFTPLPGTPIYRELLEKGEISKDMPINKYDTKPTYSPMGIEKKELKKMLKFALLKFYSKPYRIKAVIKSTSLKSMLSKIAEIFLQK